MRPAPGCIQATDLGRRFRLTTGQGRSLKATMLRRDVKRSEEFWAVRNVNFNVSAGETFGIVGHNGSGKSTLLKMIARIFGPSEGICAVGGRVSSLLELGAGFHPEFSAIENIYLAGAVYGIPRSEIDANVADIIAFAELERFAHQPIKTFSSGMFMRLGFSVAMHVRPDVLLLDEALAVGDAAFVQKCFRRIEEFREGGGTLLLVTHDASIVRRICDRALLLERGEAVMLGDARDVVDEYMRRNKMTAVAIATAESVNADRSIAGPGQHVVLKTSTTDLKGLLRADFKDDEPFSLVVRLHAVQEARGCVLRVAVKDETGFELGVRFLRDLDLAMGDDREISLTGIYGPCRDGHFIVETVVIDGESGASISGRPAISEVALTSHSADFWGPIRIEGAWQETTTGPSSHLPETTV
jgi:ABC-type polysaccharide/polyol phosphate transport system ATPase subunit